MGSVTSSSDIDGVVFLEDVNVSFQLLHEALESLLLLALVFGVGDEGKALVVVVRHLPVLLQTEQHFLETDESAVRISLHPAQRIRRAERPSDHRIHRLTCLSSSGKMEAVLWRNLSST